MQSETPQTTVKLVEFIGDAYKEQPEGIAFSYPDYLELVDWIGRAVGDDKTGVISDNLPPILTTLRIEQPAWFDMINYYDQRFFRTVGAMDKLKKFAHRLGQSWMKGQSAGRCVYKQPLPT